MMAPNTQLIQGAKSQNLRGKQTERVSDKSTAQNGQTIQADELVQIDD